MSSILNTSSLSHPIYYHRAYKDDFPLQKPTGEETENTLVEQCKRISLVALPFIALYKPMSLPLSLAMGSLQTYVSITQLIESVKTGSAHNISLAMLRTTISIAALAGTIFAHPLGMFISTGYSLICEGAQLIQNLRAGEYQKAIENCLQILNNALYLSLFVCGGLEITIASLAMQILTGLYHSQSEFRQGHSIEGLGHLLMAMIRGNQLSGQVKMLQVQQAINDYIKTTYQASSGEAVANKNTEVTNLTSKTAPAKIVTHGIVEEAKANCVNEGTLKKTKNYVYLKLNDEFMETILNKLKEINPDIKILPAVFKNGVGPHISIIRHDDWKDKYTKDPSLQNIPELNSKYKFTPTRVTLISTQYKSLCLLEVAPSAELAEVQQRYAKTSGPHGNAFHVTFAQIFKQGAPFLPTNTLDTTAVKLFKELLDKKPLQAAS